MNLPQTFRRRAARLQARGQMIILAAVALLVLALVVLITFNVTVAVQQRIKLQNYSDTKAFSMAVAEARTLNYLAYTNRAIASSYVGMANVSAYLSEAAQLADLKMGGMQIMGAISGQEYDMCYCCFIGPCCFTHCIDGAMADINVIGLTIDWVSGKMKSSLSAIDGPAASTVSALDKHIQAIRLSQTASKAAMIALLATGSFGNLKKDNMQLADSVTSDELVVAAMNEAQWNSAFDSRTDVKKKIMAETVNASRQDFAWNRSGPAATGYMPPTPMLFPQISQKMKASLWVGPTGTWLISQIPDASFISGGRTGFADSGFGMAFTGDVATGNQGKVVSSFDWSNLTGTWKHGASTAILPALGPIFPGKVTTGQSGNTHSAGFIGDLFNKPHSGANHGTNLDMSRFEEFKISNKFPFNQPSVYATVSTDTRYNEYGQRGPWEVAKDGSGTVSMTKVGPQDAKITLSNNTRSKAVSKALVYYHRIGDWSDTPNMFNPYWRAKLQPLTRAELGTVLGPVDSTAATVAGSASGIDASAVNVK